MSDRLFCIRRAILCLYLLVIGGAHADDAGLITTRLYEKEGHRYSLSVDVSPQLQSVLSEPLFPDGFEVQPAVYTKRGAMVRVEYEVVGGRFLEGGDVVLLPWGRTGAFVYATWLDGGETHSLFLNDLVGIPVEISVLKERGKEASAWESYQAGLWGAVQQWGIVCVSIVLGFGVGSRAVIARFCAFGSGVLGALILRDFYVLEVSSTVLYLWAALAALMCLRYSDKALGVIVFSYGFVLAESIGMRGDQVDTFSFVLGGALVALVGIGLGVGCRRLVKRERVLGVILGGGVVAMMLWEWSNPEEAVHAKTVVEVAPQAENKVRSQSPRRLSEPVMSFINVEPYAIRVEVMCSAEALQEKLGIQLEDERVIGLSELDHFKAEVLKAVGAMLELDIDGQPVRPETQRADFLTLGVAGAYVRESPVVESMADAIVGLSFQYLVDSPISDLEMRWLKLPIEGIEIPCSVMTSETTDGYQVGADSMKVVWSADGSVAETQVVSTVAEMPSWAPVSLLCLLGFVILRKKPMMAVAAIGIGFVSYPLVRAHNPFVSPLDSKRAEEVLGSLLGNVYRAFDYRRESVIYDALEKSISGPQLAEIYIDQQRALELERSGGARARVEDVEIISIQDIEAREEGVQLVASWKVRGSVNHFGHTHYRQNMYRAKIHLVSSSGVWTIREVEVLDEERVY
ncbi:hypothetical protein [Rubritalea tangerina]|uniref:Uncharacterized protein n=1 Tax=Rubritalea tangerina TaxID=430798 RepID=A0ABW4ZBR7_9BACT